jgi:hypothetical protein
MGKSRLGSRLGARWTRRINDGWFALAYEMRLESGVEIYKKLA